MKSIKKILIVALVLFSIGAVSIFVGLGFDGLDYIEAVNIDKLPSRLNVSAEDKAAIARGEATWEQVFNETVADYYEKFEGLNTVDLDLRASDLEIRMTNEKEASLEINAYDEKRFKISSENNSLKIEERLREESYNFITLNPLKEEISGGNARVNHKKVDVILYLPKKEYDDIDIYSSYGFVNIDDLAAKHLKVWTAYGDVTVKDVELGSFRLQNDNGDSNLENVKLGKKLSIKNYYGHVSLKECDLANAEIYSQDRVDFYGLKLGEKLEINAGYGDVNGSIYFDADKSYDFAINEERRKIAEIVYGKLDDDEGNVFIDKKLLDAHYKDREEVEVIINCAYGDVDIDAK